MGDHDKFNLNRRRAIRLMGVLTIIPLAGLWDLMVRRKVSREESRISSMLLTGIPEGNSYYDGFFISRKLESINVYSLRCTHLGCRLKPGDQDHLICPCHGSAFNPENGEPVKGPADRTLEKLKFFIRDEYLTIFIK
jgi:Rieske Fe-S protein